MKSVAIAAITLLALAGCAPAEASADNDANDAAAVEAAFLNALAAGDGTAALALTTLTADEIACTEILTEGKDHGLSILSPKTLEARVTDDIATVAFTYSFPVNSEYEQLTGSHTLVRDGDSWLVELPDEYRIVGAFPDDVVAEAGIMLAGSTDYEDAVCVAPAVDGTYEVVAFPGVYPVIFRDPTGVAMERELASFVKVYDGVASGQPQLLPYEDQLGITVPKAQVRDALNVYVDRCVASGLTDVECPRATSTPEGIVSITDHLQIDDVAVFSDDGKSWRFTATGQSFLYQANGTIESREMYYSGTIAQDPADELGIVITLD